MTSATTAPPKSQLITVLAVASAICGTIVYELTLGIVGVALPQMQGTFSATPDQIAWVLTSFTVGTTVMIGCSGWLSSRFGRKRFFLFSLVGFLVFTTLCATADSLAAEVLWRLLQGLLGAPLMPLGQAITLDAFPESKKGLASSIWATGAVGGVVTAPVLGGFLVEHYDWRWVFYVTLPVAAAALAGTWAFISETERDEERGLDWVGFTALVIAIAAVQLGLSRGEREDWFDSPEIVAEFAIAAVALALFVFRNTTAKHAFIPRELLADKNFVIGAVLFLVQVISHTDTSAVQPAMFQLAAAMNRKPMIKSLRGSVC